MSQRVTVTPYDPNWKNIFEKEAKLISDVLKDNLVSIHHIGSTSIKGLAAKPIIDIMPVVKDLKAVDSLARLFEAAGYKYMGEFGIKTDVISEKAATNTLIKYIYSSKATVTISKDTSPFATICEPTPKSEMLTQF